MLKLNFVQNFFGNKACPIGVDFGSDCLRMAQVQHHDGEYKLAAAASADVPNHVRNDLAARMNFFVETTRDLLSQGGFRGRQAVLGLPAAAMSILHLRIPKMGDDETRKALPWEIRGKIPLDPSQATLRHLIAGEVYQENEQKQEVIVMAAARETVNQLLAAAARARLDVVGMNVEPKALVDCFQNVYRRKQDADLTSFFVDIGACATRAVIAKGRQIYFARTIPIGGDHFNRAVAESMRVSLEEAKLLRIKLCLAAPPLDEQREKRTVRDETLPQAAATTENSFALLGAAMRKAEGSSEESAAVATISSPAPERAAAAAASASVPKPCDTGELVERACRGPLTRLVEELDLCRRYHEATFPNVLVDRLVFVGGEARQRSLCQSIARELGCAAQVGDPLVRIGRVSEIGIESGIDRRQPQPSWAVAIGLSMGPGGSDGPSQSETK